MPIGTGGEVLQNIPGVNFKTDPALFFNMTSKNVSTPKTTNDPGAGGTDSVVLPQVGVIAKLRINFVGQAVVASAAATSSNRWPYGLLDDFKLSANGQNDLFACDGLDLTALRWLRYPSYVEDVDQFPGTVGGGDSVGVATHALNLVWEVPIAVDDTSLIGALYAQSAATNLTATYRRAANATLFSANPANVTITGVWHWQVEHYDIPVDPQGIIVVPDLSQLHGFQALDTPYTAVGEARTPLLRSSGQLNRLLVKVDAATNTRLSALPSAASSRKLDELRLEYGGNRRPYVYKPASTLLSKNNEQYGGTCPYDYLVLDFIRENPVRDRVLLQGVTELAVVPTVGSGVTVSAGKVRVVRDLLF